MPELSCTCPHCSQELNISSEFSGQAVACPSCSGEFTVPDAPAAQAPALAAPPQLNVPAAPALQRPPIQPQAPPQHQQAPPQHQQAPPHNPYQAPASQPIPQQYGGGGPSPHGIQLFAKTKPWVTLFAVLGSITPAIMVVMGVLTGFVGASAGEVAGGVAGGVMMILIGAIYFLPAWRLWQYSGAIGKLRFTPTHQALDFAIDRQRCFWKTVGIITVCAFVVWVAFFFLVIATASAVDSDAFSIPVAP